MRESQAHVHITRPTPQSAGILTQNIDTWLMGSRIMTIIYNYWQIFCLDLTLHLRTHHFIDKKQPTKPDGGEDRQSDDRLTVCFSRLLTDRSAVPQPRHVGGLKTSLFSPGVGWGVLEFIFVLKQTKAALQEVACRHEYITHYKELNGFTDNNLWGSFRCISEWIRLFLQHWHCYNTQTTTEVVTFY